MSADPRAVLLLEDDPDDEELTIRGLRRANRHNPIDLARDGQEDGDLMKGYDRSANSYVCKPIQFNVFTAAIEQLAVYWLTVNHPQRARARQQQDAAQAAGDLDAQAVAQIASIDGKRHAAHAARRATIKGRRPAQAA